jgi:hypothetical protein
MRGLGTSDKRSHNPRGWDKEKSLSWFIRYQRPHQLLYERYLWGLTHAYYRLSVDIRTPFLLLRSKPLELRLPKFLLSS